MKLSELIAATPPGADPDIAVMLPWGEIEPAVLLSLADICDDDPAWVDIAKQSPGTFIVTTAPAA